MAARKKTLGRVAYAAFERACADLNVGYEPFGWDKDMTVNECEVWERAARAVVREYKRRQTKGCTK